MLHADNAVTELAEAVARHRPARVAGPPDPRGRGVPRRGRRQRSASSSPRTTRRRPRQARPASPGWSAPPCTNTVNPTMLDAGYKVNVIPQHGHGPGRRPVPARPRGRVPRRGRRAARAGGVRREFVHHDIAVETTFDGDLVRRDDRRAPAPRTRTPRVVPYCLSGGTDAKSFSRLGIRCFGFAPLRLPAGPRLLRHVPRRSTSGSRSTRCGSASGCSTASSTSAS